MRRLLIAGLMLAGCAHAPATVTTTTPPPTTSAKHATVDERLETMTRLVEARDFAGAIADTDAWLAEQPPPRTVALIYNCRTWLRWGAGDKKGAAAENEKVRASVANAEPKVAHGALQHYWWDRAYLEAEAGRLEEAERSRAEFERISTDADDADSKKVLEAWIAFRRGDGAAARAAAGAVDPAKDGDLQDLYVLACALEAGGDAAGAASIRDRIKGGPRYPMKPTILQQMARDTSRCQ